jgi:chemotaxis protein CheZ
MTDAAHGDSAELEALFDSVASQAAPAVAAPVKSAAEAGGDNDDLQALFDSVASSAGLAEVAAGDAASSAVAETGNWPTQDVAFNRVGQMARQLHDMLRGLGYDKLLEKTATAMPDARDRLAYVANLTEQAACRVLNATDVALPAQEALDSSTRALADRWERLYANQLTVVEFKQLADETRAFLGGELTQVNATTRAQLMEIMMAQDFQDLTGQVIKKVVAMAQELETQMMGLLVDVMPAQKKTESVANLLNGPVISADGRADVVVNQQQVDDLLDNLGF